MKTALKLLIFIVLLKLLATVQNADAKAIAVHSTADDGPGSLREAIVQASNGDKINIVVNGTITLTSGELLVDKSLTVKGPGPHGTISGNNTSRVFHITPGTNVILDSLTITNGAASTDVGVFPASAGGAIYIDHANVTVNNCAVSSSSAHFGGGMFSNTENSSNGSLTVNNTTISDNSATYGGGIYNDAENGSATMTVTNTTIRNNSAVLGGGVYNDGETGGNAVAIIDNSVVSSNTAEVLGGGIHNDAEFGRATTTLNNTTVTQNAVNSSLFVGISEFHGAGGIFNDGFSGQAFLAVKSSTVRSNIVTASFTGQISVQAQRPSDSPLVAERGRGGVTNNSIGKSRFLRDSVSSRARLTPDSLQDQQFLVTLWGGGIWNHGLLGNAIVTITNSDISANSAADNLNTFMGGGGIYNNGDSGSASVDVRDSSLLNNFANGEGGAMFNGEFAGFASVTLVNCAINNNSSRGDGGALLGVGYLGTVTFTLTNSAVVGNSVTEGGSGGGIFIQNQFGSGTAELTLSSCVVKNNSANAFAGGGIAMDETTAVLTNTTISGNSAPNFGIGGGIAIDQDLFSEPGLSRVNLTNCTVSGNSSDFFGGGIINAGAELDLIGCTISNNSTPGAGGGIFNENAGRNITLKVENSTVSGNSAGSLTSDGEGGGIFNGGLSDTATVILMNSTVSGNLAAFGAGILNVAFGVGPDFIGHGIVQVSNSTFSGNSAGSGGGIFTWGVADSFGTATAEVANTIFNAGASGENLIAFQDGTVTSQGYNLSSDSAGGDNTTGSGGLLNGPGDIRNTNPMLGPLQNNGGSTMTHALSKSSPAINAGDPNFNPYLFNPPLFYDQRGPGFPRIVGGRLDIGAFESKPH